MKKVKKILIVILFLTVVLGLYKLAEIYSPGSYPYVELYDFDCKESAFIKLVNEFKEKNPRLVPPDRFHLQDGRKGSEGYWYSIYLYCPENQQIVHLWTRQTALGRTNVGFVGVTEGPGLGKWKLINKDYSSSENRRQKQKFDQLFIRPLQLMLKEKNK